MSVVHSLPHTGHLPVVPDCFRGMQRLETPAFSSGALSLLSCLRGQWHYSSAFLGGVFMGGRNRLTDRRVEFERLPLPGALLDRLKETEEKLKAIL